MYGGDGSCSSLFLNMKASSIIYAVSMASSSPYSLFLMLLWLIPVSVIAQNNRTQGSSLTAVLNQNSSWTSPSGEYAFGFQQTEPGSFLLAIWFDKIPEKTVIWSANGGNLMHEGSKAQLTTGGQFVLSDPTGQAVWTAPLDGSGSLSYAAMLDSGNFVLASQDSTTLWQSFDQPTDTILPTQVINTGGSLLARYSDTNYSSGRFVMQLAQSGSLALSTTDFPFTSANAAYWTATTDGGGFQVIYNQSGYIYLEAKNGSIIASIASVGASTSNFYQRAILEYDGVFRQYVYPKNSSASAGRPMAWSLLSYVPENICRSITQATGSGACGFNSYCSLGNDQRPTCECPPGYSYLDPDNSMNGCKQDFVSQECDGGNDANLFYFRDMSNADWPLSDYQHFAPVKENWCRQACLSDCFCAVAIFRNGPDGDCWFKKIPLSNGFVDSSYGGKAMIKIRKDNSTGTSPGADSNKKTQILVGTLLLSSSAFLNLVLLVSAVWLVCRLRSGKRRTLQLQPYKMMQGTNLRSFTYKELEEATDNFKEELGKGAFSTVYKGVSVSDTDGKSLIAVKRLNKMVTEGEQEFHAELSSIGKTNHKNLVQLLGFCDEGQHRVLVYEYMRNGSLASYLFGNSRPSWYKRAQIALGTAKGLVYLHEECSTQIIHCDIKPQNILLDDSLTARISDFGLAKLLQTGQTRTLTAIRGTKGYVAPEWFKNMPVTVKIDVYSFGILLLELICCRKNFDQDKQNENQMILADWAYDCYEDRTLHLLVQEDEEAMQDLKKVKEFVMIAIWCIQDDPSLRPTMKRVLQMLEGAIEVPLPPLNLNSSVQFKLEKRSWSTSSIEESG